MAKTNSKNNYSSKALILIFILALVLGLLLGFIFFRSSAKTFSNNDMNLTYDTLVNEYIDKINEEELNEAAIKGMMDYMKKEVKDDYTVYYDKKDTTEFNELLMGTFYGTGAEIYKTKEGPVAIARVFKDSPSEKAGLKPGDKYMKINGEDVSKKDPEQISKMIKGKNKK